MRQAKPRGFKRESLAQNLGIPQSGRKLTPQDAITLPGKSHIIKGKRAASIEQFCLTPRQRSHRCAAAKETCRSPDAPMIQAWHCCGNTVQGKPRSQQENKAEFGKSQQRPARTRSCPNCRVQGTGGAAGGQPPARCCGMGATCATPAQGCSDLAQCSLAVPGTVLTYHSFTDCITLLVTADGYLDLPPHEISTAVAKGLLSFP